MRFIYLLVMSSVVFLLACGGSSGGGLEEDLENEIDELAGSSGSSSSSSSSSSSGMAGSHNAGEDCMTSGCHAAGSSGPRFYAAGTVFRSGGGGQGNAQVRMYLQGTNTLVASMNTDASGNFYTTMAVEGLFTGGDLVQGTDVEVEGPTGIHTMPGNVTNGSCNSCHHTGSGGNGRIVVN